MDRYDRFDGPKHFLEENTHMAMRTSLHSLTSLRFWHREPKSPTTSELSNDMIKAIHRQCPNFSAEMLAQCRISRASSNFATSHGDMDITDAEGKVVIHGRDFGGGNSFFWVA
jgi:hypothetical protein